MSGIKGSQIRSETITGSQIQNDTVTGSDINEDTLILKYFTTHKYTMTSSSDPIFIRFNAAGSNTSGGVNNRFVAPASGTIRYVAYRTDGTPGNTEIAFCKLTDGTATFGSGAPSADVTENVSSSNTTYIFNFSSLSSPNDITFAAGNVLGIRINPTNNHGNADLTVVWEFDWS